MRIHLLSEEESGGQGRIRVSKTKRFSLSADLLTKTWAAEYGLSGVPRQCSEPWAYADGGYGGNGRAPGTTGRPGPRPASADEIAEAIVFLATDGASFIYGAKLAVDGGRTAI
jgi:NAD(P)-dependent dehydrogenase (short-subunit alcohol dehydrogenase family)